MSEAGPLLASIRKRCKSGLWAQGGTLARAAAVAGPHHAKQIASRIALVLQHNIAADRGAELTNAS